MTRRDEIRARLERAAIEPATFAQHAKSDIKYLLELTEPVALKPAPFDPKTVELREDGHYYVPMLPKELN